MAGAKIGLPPEWTNAGTELAHRDERSIPYHVTNSGHTKFECSNGRSAPTAAT